MNWFVVGFTVIRPIALGFAVFTICFGLFEHGVRLLVEATDFKLNS